MSAFNIPSIMKICEDDTIHLEELASDKKVALFVVTPDTTTAYNFLAAVMFQQCFQILVHTADNREDHCLPRHVRFLLDEFPNIGMIPDLPDSDQHHPQPKYRMYLDLPVNRTAEISVR